MAKTKVVICPYCGETQPAGERCRACGGFFEPHSRQATHNAMGPWFVRDDTRPYQPGCSYETLVRMIRSGRVTKYTIIRGPSTRQFWTVAKHVPGIAHLLGYCPNCDAQVEAHDLGCHACGLQFGAYLDRNYLGLPDIKPLPWEVNPDEDEPVTGRLQAFGPFASGSDEPISSFGSDSELTDPGGFRASTYAKSAATVTGASGAKAAQSTDSSSGSQSRDEGKSSQDHASTEVALLEEHAELERELATTTVRIRSLERHANAQRSMARALGVLLAISIVIVLVLSYLLITKGDAPIDPAPDTEPAVLSEADRQRWQNRTTAARELAITGLDDDVDVLERLAALREAISAFERIDRDAPAGMRPDDLDATLSALREALAALEADHI